MRRYKLLGIDPAPAKKSVVFDGERFFEFGAFELKEFLDDYVDSSTLISWDAPLGSDFSASLSYKPIEKILNTKTNYKDNQKPPRGISTLPFASCPHWAISQYVLGFPIVNTTIVDKEKLTYHLVENQDDLITTKPNLFETHPAFSMWVFLKDTVSNFKYKGDKDSKKVFESVKEALFALEFLQKYSFIKEDITNDDRLDSFLAYINLELFLQNKAFVYGDSKKGAMLLPDLRDVLKGEILAKL